MRFVFLAFQVGAQVSKFEGRTRGIESASQVQVDR